MVFLSFVHLAPVGLFCECCRMSLLLLVGFNDILKLLNIGNYH